jgi:hypothetical protein
MADQCAHEPGLYLGSPDDYRNGISLMGRFALAAEFVAKRHAAEFEAYWAENWPGEATGSDFLAAVRGGLADRLFCAKRPWPRGVGRS